MSEFEKPPNFDERAAAAKFYVVWQTAGGELVAQASEQATPTPEALNLLQRIQFAYAMVSNSSVVRDKADRSAYQKQLLSYAMTGLEYGSVSTAQAALRWFEDRVTEQQGLHIRRRHVGATLMVAGLIGVPALAAGLALPHLISATAANVFRIELALLGASLWLLVGNALGITFFAFVRNLELRFDQLSRLDPDRLEPWLRFIFVVIATAIFATFLVVGVVQFGIGGTLLNDFVDRTNFSPNPLLCILVGILAGFADSTVIATLIGSLKGGGQRS